MVLVGKINKEIVAQLHVAGVSAVGLAGDDGGLIEAAKASSPDADLGFVGQVAGIDTRVLERLADFVPVVASVGVDPDGQSYNINADTVAGRLAAALGARRAIFLTDVEGIMRDVADPASLVSECRLADIREMAASGAVGAGMLPEAGGDRRRARVGGRGGAGHRRAHPALGAGRDLHRGGHRDEDHRRDRRAPRPAGGGRADADLPPPAGGLRARRGRGPVRRRRAPLRRLHGRHLDEQRRPLPPGRRGRDRRPVGAPDQRLEPLLHRADGRAGRVDPRPLARRAGLLLQLRRGGERGRAEARAQARRPGPAGGGRAGRRLPRPHLRRAVADRPALQAGALPTRSSPGCATSSATTWRPSRRRSGRGPARSCSRSSRARSASQPGPARRCSGWPASWPTGTARCCWWTRSRPGSRARGRCSPTRTPA